MQLGPLFSNKTFPNDLSSFVIQFHFPVSAEGLKAFGRFQWNNLCCKRRTRGQIRQIHSQSTAVLQSWRTGGARRENTHTSGRVFFRMSLPWTKTAGPVDRHPGRWVRPDPIETESSCHDRGGLVSALPHFQWSSLQGLSIWKCALVWHFLWRWSSASLLFVSQVNCLINGNPDYYFVFLNILPVYFLLSFLLLLSAAALLKSVFIVS